MAGKDATDAEAGDHEDSIRDTLATILEQTRDHGDFPPDVNLEIMQQILTGAVATHLTTYPDTSTAVEIEAYLLAVLRQTCYRRSQV